MITMCVYYPKADSPEDFERRYIDGHIPLVRAYDNIKDMKFEKVSKVVAGDFPYEYVFTAVWADRDAMKADLASPAAAAAMADAQSFATQGFHVVVFDTLA